MNTPTPNLPESVVTELLALIPTNWCDPLLTGPDAVINGPVYDGHDIERLLLAIRKRIQDASSSPGEAYSTYWKEQWRAENARAEGLEALLNTPELHDFAKGAVLEAAHQRDRWGNDHDAGKEPADWFWLLGYLAGKALKAHNDGNTEKALHHTISSAAALANWHGSILGTHNMRPGIDGEAAIGQGSEE